MASIVYYIYLYIYRNEHKICEISFFVHFRALCVLIIYVNYVCNIIMFKNGPVTIVQAILWKWILRQICHKKILSMFRVVRARGLSPPKELV